MGTITLWLLVAVGYPIEGSQTRVVERFIEAQDCQEVRKAIESESRRVRLACIKADIAAVQFVQPSTQGVKR